MKNVAVEEEVVDHEELEARGDEMIAEGHLLRAKAARARHAAGRPDADPWVPIKALAIRHEVKERRIRDAGNRGEIQLHKLGDLVVCRRSAFDSWIEAHPVVAKVVPVAEESAEQMYSRMAGGR